MSDYSRFARFYDALMGDPKSKTARLVAAVDRYLPDASSVLELLFGRPRTSSPTATR